MAYGIWYTVLKHEDPTLLVLGPVYGKQYNLNMRILHCASETQGRGGFQKLKFVGS